MTTREEEDLKERSTKKVKGGEHDFTNNSTVPLSYADIADDMGEGFPVRKTYKETVTGASSSHGPQTEKEGVDHGGSGWPGCTEKGVLGDIILQIVEKKHGGYDCLEIIIPASAEDRLCRPWKQSLIVKLLGRRIGFKALENRLKQMWVKKGVMNIIDLGCDFFLVYLSSQEDHDRALGNGPWLIYDHYLTIREWRLNFRPELEEIDRVAVWVRLPELPIEYYDPDFLFFLGNRIGKTVKVDKTTQQMARGRYARLCVEVDLHSPLLAMFEVKGRVYKIEYEGLHLLCMACGKFGHYRDQCTVQDVPEGVQREDTVEGHGGRTGEHTVTLKENGPWTIVQKQRWPKKGRDNGGPVAEKWALMRN